MSTDERAALQIGSRVQCWSVVHDYQYAVSPSDCLACYWIVSVATLQLDTPVCPALQADLHEHKVMNEKALSIICAQRPQCEGLKYTQLHKAPYKIARLSPLGWRCKQNHKLHEPNNNGYSWSSWKDCATSQACISKRSDTKILVDSLCCCLNPVFHPASSHLIQLSLFLMKLKYHDIKSSCHNVGLTGGRCTSIQNTAASCVVSLIVWYNDSSQAVNCPEHLCQQHIEGWTLNQCYRGSKW